MDNVNAEVEFLALVISFPELLDDTILKSDYFNGKNKIMFEIVLEERNKNNELIIDNLCKHNNFDIDYYTDLLTFDIVYVNRETRFNELEKILIDNYKTNQFKELINKFDGDCESLYNQLSKVNEINYNENDYIKAMDMVECLTNKKKKIELGYPILDYNLNLSQNDLLILAAGTGCVDCDTEYFDGYSWKKISEYKKGDKILQYNPKDGKAILLEPIKYIKENCDNLHLIKTKYGLDMCLSDEHTIYYLDDKNNLKNISCENMINIHNKNKKGFGGKFITSFNYSGKGINLSDDEIKLMLAIIADGSFDKKSKSNRCYIKIKKQRKIEELMKILEDAKIDYNVHKRENGYYLFSFIAPIREKEFSEYWYNCNHNQLKLICDNVLKWDGNNKDSFFSTSKKTIDFVQFAFSSCGYRANISIEDRIGRKRVINSKGYLTKTIDYVLHISNNNLTSMKSSTKTNIVDYKPIDGKKYCFTTYTGLWIMRRNGKICITGNCGKTAFALNLMSKLSKEYQVVYFNMEMSKNILYRRLLAIESQIEITKLNDITALNDSEKHELKAIMRSIEERKIILVNQVLTMEQIKKTINRIKTDKHVIVFIDHIGLIKSKGTSLYEKMTNTAKELRGLSINNDCTVIGLCQLSRESQRENVMPKLQDLRDSGEVEQSARKVIMLYNKEPDSTLRKVDMQVIIAKNDDGTNKKVGDFTFDKLAQTFEEKYK